MSATTKMPTGIAKNRRGEASKHDAGRSSRRRPWPRRAKVRTRPSDPEPARISSTMSGPVAVGPHVKSARPGVLMLTRRSPTATSPASGDPDRTSVTRCDVPRARNMPSEPAGARTTTVSEAVAGRVLATASRSRAREWSRRVMLCAPRLSRLDSFVFSSYRGLAVGSSRPSGSSQARRGSQARGAAPTSARRGSPWAPPASGRGEAAAHEHKVAGAAPRRYVGPENGHGGLGEPKLVPAAAFLPLPRPDRKIDAKVSWPGGR